jgi:hypothetical protein
MHFWIKNDGKNVFLDKKLIRKRIFRSKNNSGFHVQIQNQPKINTFTPKKSSKPSNFTPKMHQKSTHHKQKINQNNSPAARNNCPTFAGSRRCAPRSTA